MVGKARSFSDSSKDTVYQKEFDDEVYAAAAQQNSYNLGSVHFSDQSGIANISQAGSDQRKANLKGALFQGNIGFNQQTAVLDVPSTTIDLLEDSASVALSLISTDRLVSLSTGTTSDLVTITGAQRPGHRLYLFGILGNTITIKHTVAATANTILTPDEGDFDFSDNMVVELVYDISTSKWRIVSGVSGGTGAAQTPWLSNIDAAGFSLNNLLSLDIEDSAGATKLNISGPLGVGSRFAFVAGDSVFFTENITDKIEIDTTGLKLLANDITMGTGGNIVGGGAGEGMTNVGHFDFIDNLATPAAAISLYSDGTDLFANTGGGVVNFSDVGGGVFPDNTFRVTGSVDATKLLAFEVDGLTTATTRTWTVPDASSNLVLDNLSNLNATTAINTNLLAGTDQIRDLGSPSFVWDEIFGRTLIFESENKPVDATETAIGASTTELWLNQTNLANVIAFRWDDVGSYQFTRTIFNTQSPVLAWQMLGATNNFAITNLSSIMDFTASLAEDFRFTGLSHTKFTLVGIGFTTAGLNDDEILFNSSNSTASDIVGQMHFVGHTDTAANFDIAKIVALNEVPTNATRSGLLEFRLSSSGTENDLFIDLAGFSGLINIRKELDMNNNKIADIGETTITDLSLVTGAAGDLVMVVDATDGLMKRVNVNDFLGGGSQTPWLSNIDADGFDLTDLSNIQFRNTTGAPGTGNNISADAGGMNIRALAANDSIDFFLGSSVQLALEEDGELRWPQDGHKLVPQGTAFQMISSSTTDRIELTNGTGSTNAILTLENTRCTWRTQTSSIAAYALQLIQNNNTPADFRTIVNIDMIAENSSSVDTIYARVSGSSQDITNATEDGLLQLGVVSGGTLIASIDMEGNSAGGSLIGFFGVTPVAQQSPAANSAAIITALENLGLFV